MPSDIRWVTPDELITLNAIVTEATGEPHLLRDRALLESAAAAPLNRHAYAGESDLLTLAVALLFAVARNHPFEQGNTRTAFVACDVMLKANDLRIAAPDTRDLADAIVAVIAREGDEAAFAARLRPHVVALG